VALYPTSAREVRLRPCCDLGIKVTPALARIIPRGLFTESTLAWRASLCASALIATILLRARF
jgi:hypothetical protein